MTESSPRIIFRISVLAAFFLSGIILPASGKVFRLFGGSDGDAFQNGSLPWDSAYRTQMTVNGRKATVKIYAARYTEPVEEQLKRRFEDLGAQVLMARSESGATGTAKWPDRSVGFIVMSPPGEPLQQIVIYEPEPGTKGVPGRLPVPAYPQGKVVNVISDDDTGTLYATLESSASATDAHSFYARELPAQGWSMVAPAMVRHGTISGMAVYQKKKKICYVQATDRVGGLNMITLLVKGGAL
jgi:hypothetical protein